MSELDLLRHIRVISTVSGGSIIGVLYYLHVKNLLERKQGPVTREDYVEIVQAIEEDFVWAVQKNIRARMFWNVAENFHMASKNYSRTSRIASELERFFYRPVWFGKVERWKRIQLRDLAIADNAARGDAVVPTLLINATSLNTGRNWRFETDKMGESMPTDKSENEIARDLNPAFVLAARSFSSGGRHCSLGVAVAASAALPTVFHPVTIRNEYEVVTRRGKVKRIQAELVDGGVHDNQGIQGLFDHKCSHFIVSDASGQFHPQWVSGTKIPQVAQRALAISNARLRQEQLTRAHKDPACTFVLIHLRRGVTEPVLVPGQRVDEDTGVVKTDFDVSASVQRRLARIRTDLDNFGDVEAGALMLDAYKMMDHEMTRSWSAFQDTELSIDPLEVKGSGSADASRWHFAVLDQLLREPTPKFDRLLAVGTQRFVKPLRFFDWVPWLLFGLLTIGVAVALGSAAASASMWAGIAAPEWPAWLVVVCAAGTILVFACYFGAIYAPGRVVAMLFVSRLMPAVLAIPLWVMSLTQLMFNSLYLHLASYGSVGLAQQQSHAEAAMGFSKRPPRR